MTRVCLVLAALLFGALGVVVSPEPAYACSCAGISTTRALRNADAVFRGRVTGKESVGWRDERRIDLRFDVDAVYKGTVYRDQVVASPIDSAACGLNPEAGTTWIIFAVEGIEGAGDDAVSRLITTLCSGNLPTASAPAVLGASRVPLDGASDRDEKSTDADRRLTRALAIGGLGLLVVGTLAAMGLAVLWRPGRQR
jgi:hypothetical protein